MLCQQCGRENPPEARFCHQCGSSLRVVCSQCGTELPLAPDLRFCFSCGADLGAKPFASKGERRTQPAGVDEERRLVTVLFADLVGFTAMSERMDPEDVRERAERLFRRSHAADHSLRWGSRKVHWRRHPGRLWRAQAHEEDPERAVRAALAMQQAITTLNDRLAKSSAATPGTSRHLLTSCLSDLSRSDL